MLIRYKAWFVDGLPSKTIDINHDQLVFHDNDKGILDVRKKQHIETLLKNSDFELVYEDLGISFDADGNQIDSEPITNTEGPGLIEATAKMNTEETKPKKRGRPRRS